MTFNFRQHFPWAWRFHSVIDEIAGNNVAAHFRILLFKRYNLAFLITLVWLKHKSTSNIDNTSNSTGSESISRMVELNGVTNALSTTVNSIARTRVNTETWRFEFLPTLIRHAPLLINFSNMNTKVATQHCISLAAVLPRAVLWALNKRSDINLAYKCWLHYTPLFW